MKGKLKKYPFVRGAERFKAFWVAIEILSKETRTESQWTTKRVFGEQYPGGYKDIKELKDYEVEYFLVKEKGKPKKWVPARDVEINL